MSMLVKNTSPTRRPAPIVSGSRDDARSPMLGPYSARDESRYLVPASSQGRDHHRRQYSATQADVDRLSGRGEGRVRGEYHLPGGYNQKSYADHRASVRDDDYSYTGPREQFTRDMQARPPPSGGRDGYVRRERPMSVMEIPELKAPVTRRERDLMPPPPPRPVERVDRSEDRRLSRQVFDKEDRVSDLPSRRQSVRAPVVHQLRDEGYSSARDDIDVRSKPRRDRIDEEELLPKQRPRDLDREYPRERDLPKESERERDRDRDLRERDRERDRDRDRERDHERDRLRRDDKGKYPEDRREVRSRENSPERSGIGKAVATGLGGAAVAGLTGAALKGSSKPEEASDSDRDKERRHRKHKHRDREDLEPDPREGDPSDRRLAPPLDDRVSKRDESASESYEDDQQRRRHRRRKHRDREELDPTDTRPQDGELVRDPRDALNPDDDKYRRRHDRAASRNREPDDPELERRTISPGEDEDDRPRRVQLVEPESKESFKPKGILKAPRTVPFPEDPNPTREGVAPLKEAGKDGKDGIPQGARWTKISRVLVNPEALEKAHERFEERDDYVIVLRVISREEIEKLAEKTQEIRGEYR
jgi:hypothetical protein